MSTSERAPLTRSSPLLVSKSVSQFWVQLLTLQLTTPPTGDTRMLLWWLSLKSENTSMTSRTSQLWCQSFFNILSTTTPRLDTPLFTASVKSVMTWQKNSKRSMEPSCFQLWSNVSMTQCLEFLLIAAQLSPTSWMVPLKSLLSHTSHRFLQFLQT